MAVRLTGGQIKTFTVDGTAYDPIGDWSITPAYLQMEHDETTRMHSYFTQTPMPGVIEGQIKLDGNINIIEAITSTDSDFSREVIIETSNNITFSGQCAFTGEPTLSHSDGRISIKYEGCITQK